MQQYCLVSTVPVTFTKQADVREVSLVAQVMKHRKLQTINIGAIMVFTAWVHYVQKLRKYCKASQCLKISLYFETILAR